MKRYLLYILFLLQGFAAHAESIDSLFTRVPDNVLPMLAHNARLDLLDLYNYKMTAKAENDFGGTSYLLVKAENFLHLKLTDVSQWSLKRLASQNDTILCCVHSIIRPAIASSISFYDNQWQPLKIELPQPEEELFWQPSDSLTNDRIAELQARLDFSAFIAAWDVESNELTFRIAISDLNEEDRKDAEHCLRPVTYVWQERQFVLK